MSVGNVVSKFQGSSLGDSLGSEGGTEVGSFGGLSVGNIGGKIEGGGGGTYLSRVKVIPLLYDWIPYHYGRV